MIQMTENNLHKSRVRKYRKSSSSRLRWTPELHQHFVEAVHNLGGKYRATPKRIMHMMGVNGLKISHVKSHLQMHRSMKKHLKFDGSTTTKSFVQKDKDKPHHIRLPQRGLDAAKEEGAPKQFISKIINKFDNKEANHFRGAQGTSNSAITESDLAEIPMADMEINIWALPNTIHRENNSESSKTPINLDLTM